MVNTDMEVSISGGTPLSLEGLFHRTSHVEIDDDWGYPYFKKTPIWMNGDYWQGITSRILLSVGIMRMIRMQVS